MIKQVYAPYTQWEDWQNGMYRDVSKSEHESLVRLAKSLLSDSNQLKKAMADAVDTWPISAAVNLTDQTKNHRPWLGQAACCLHYRCTELSVREAWNGLDAETQRTANMQADQVYEIFCLKADDTKQLTFGFYDAN